MKTKKRNPQDATLRNVRSANMKFDELERRMARVEQILRVLKAVLIIELKTTTKQTWSDAK